MNPTGSTDNDSLNVDLARRVDEGCDRFETAWSAGPRPRIEDELGPTPVGDRPTLPRELLALELDLRRVEGEAPDLDEYLRRFPDHAGCVSTIFEAALEVSTAGHDLNQGPSCGAGPATRSDGRGPTGTGGVGEGRQVREAFQSSRHRS